jgi:glutathione S-transferase
MMNNKAVDKRKLDMYKVEMSKVIGHMDKYFLRDRPYLCGDDITLADLLGACELMQLAAVEEENFYQANPVVNAWMKRVGERLGPVFGETNKVLWKLKDIYKQMQPTDSKL